MGGKVVNADLGNGGTVSLAHWENLKPTEHGTGQYNTAWSQHKDRQGLAFYESTVQYMRNDWASQHMQSQIVSDNKGQNALLYYHNTTKTWHTADALDIDHAVQWKDHLAAKKVTNMADAQMAYNDVDNLRMLPSIYNRARDSADKILGQHGAQSPQWKEWVDQRFTFDNALQFREFDPEKDSARRMKTTKDQPWSEDNTRAELSFDKRVMEVWFNNELQKNYVGSPRMTNPDGSGTTDVPLFRCAATGQLVTRDALDIDHAIPLEQVLKKMHDMFPQGFSKADALDAYNDTSNLRLVGRSANSSHEWEIMPDGHFRDSKVTEIPGEFKKFIVENGDLGIGEKYAVHQAMGEIREHQRSRMQEYFAQQSPTQPTSIHQAPLLPPHTGPYSAAAAHSAVESRRTPRISGIQDGGRWHRQPRPAGQGIRRSGSTRPHGIGPDGDGQAPRLARYRHRRLEQGRSIRLRRLRRPQPGQIRMAGQRRRKVADGRPQYAIVGDDPVAAFLEHADASVPAGPVDSAFQHSLSAQPAVVKEDEPGAQASGQTLGTITSRCA